MTTARSGAQSPNGVWLPANDHGGQTVASPQCANPPMPWTPVGPLNALHASLIPTGAHQGHVMVWDHLHYHGDYTLEERVLHYSIIEPLTDPAPPVFHNHIASFPTPSSTCLPKGEGDLFCAGHGWNAEGHLVVAGGSTAHSPPATNWGGARLVYVWTPPGSIGAPGTWYFPKTTGNLQHFLVKHRWYPSVVALCPHATQTSQDRMLILGGIHGTAFQDDYECWEELATPTTNPEGRLQSLGTPPVRLWNGPGNPVFSLFVYPRTHTLSTNFVATAGFSLGTARLKHPANPGVWETKSFTWVMSSYRSYGSSVLFPISTIAGLQDQIVAIGGNVGSTILDTVDICNAAVPQAQLQWTPLTALSHRRHFLNAVLLPDTKVLVIGGEKQYVPTGCSDDPALVPELYEGGGWTQLAASPFIRDYHSCALLLPDGSVFVSGGESRHHTAANGNCPTKGTPHNQPADYQIFQPPYITSGNPRPTIQNAPMAGAHWDWAYGTTQTVNCGPLPPGVSIDKITLLRAGSVTHHADPNQRCVELTWESAGETPEGDLALNVTVPTRTANLRPRGFYMLFLVSNQGTPSFAVWVKIQ